jgi:hypothetical protein
MPYHAAALSMGDAPGPGQRLPCYFILSWSFISLLSTMRPPVFAWSRSLGAPLVRPRYSVQRYLRHLGPLFASCYRVCSRM